MYARMSHAYDAHECRCTTVQCRRYEVASCRTMRRVSRRIERDAFSAERASSRRAGRFIDPPRRHPSTGNKEPTRQKPSRLSRSAYVLTCDRRALDSLAGNKILKAGRRLKRVETELKIILFFFAKLPARYKWRFEYLLTHALVQFANRIFLSEMSERERERVCVIRHY